MAQVAWVRGWCRPNFGAGGVGSVGPYNFGVGDVDGVGRNFGVDGVGQKNDMGLNVLLFSHTV